MFITFTKRKQQKTIKLNWEIISMFSKDKYRKCTVYNVHIIFGFKNRKKNNKMPKSNMNNVFCVPKEMFLTALGLSFEKISTKKKTKEIMI